MKTERVQTWAAVAEIVSAIAIVISLLYVGYEFRRAGTLSSNEVDTLLFERVREMNAMLIQEPDLASLVLLARDGPAEMSEADQLRYVAYQHIFFDSWEVAWLYHEDRVLDDVTWKEWDDWFVAEARRRPAWGWTENRHHFTGTDFRNHVDRAIADQ
jgi:hypothetical protein